MSRHIRLRWPSVHASQPVATGMYPLQLERTAARARGGFFFVPSMARAGAPLPLAISLHGAGGDGKGALSLLRDQAEEHGFVVLAPDAREHTWDVLIRDLGPDVQFINRALGAVCRRVAVDENRLAISGFSDGASYALTVGILNGHLSSHILAFSPGFTIPQLAKDSPRIFVSHGTGDRVLPIECCSRVIVPQLRAAGLDFTYREFDGPHTVPLDIANRGVDWFLTGEGKNRKRRALSTQ